MSIQIVSVTPSFNKSSNSWGVNTYKSFARTEQGQVVLVQAKSKCWLAVLDKPTGKHTWSTRSYYGKVSAIKLFVNMKGNGDREEVTQVTSSQFLAMLKQVPTWLQVENFIDFFGFCPLQ